jgi:Na+/H+ antiporter NhaD/arsenite permease-like protein
MSYGLMAVHLLPFVMLLLLIALLPLAPSRISRWWEKSSSKLLVSAVCGIAGALLFSTAGHPAKIAETSLDYLTFISLLASLYIVSSGIHISGTFAGFPWFNTFFLGLGAVAANVLGTTGASVLLIRPLLRANQARSYKTHIVIFFILTVSNCGGLLTMLGDPPLYLGFLRGVPAFWTLRLLPHWALAIFLLLVLFYLLDRRFYRREETKTHRQLAAEASAPGHRLRIQGKGNFLALLAILGIVIFSGYMLSPLLVERCEPWLAAAGPKLFQCLGLGLIAWISFRFTRPSIHAQNHFSFHPIQEVAVLFFGIFCAMLPALALLEHRAPSLPISQPWHYFWLSGLLSSFLDNAPTYLLFATLAASRSHLSPLDLGMLAAQSPALLAAISCGSVFMGANTYIGNGPNFMVKAIAEHAHVRMPSFFGYMLWSLAILTPIYLLETYLFF